MTDSLTWIDTASLEIDYPPITEPTFIYNRVPKKLHRPMEIDRRGICPPIGWAIWIEEDFVVPWFIPVTFFIIAIAVFVFALWYTAEQGPKANGWTIGTGLLSILTFVFTAWVLRTKDSKHR